MQPAKKIFIILLVLLLVQPVLALENYNGITIKTKWGIVGLPEANWAVFEYFEEGKIKSTHLYWYHLNFTTNISKINETNDFRELNIMHKTFISEISCWVDINISVKEYKTKPFTEVIIRSSSSRELFSMLPNFGTRANGRFIIAPGVIENKETKFGDGTDNTWPLVVDKPTSDNYALIYTPNCTTTLFITNKIFTMTSWDKGDHWENYFTMWRFEDVKPNKSYTHTYWITPINIAVNDSTERIKAKASDLAHEALVKTIKIYENITRGHDYWFNEIWYKFEKVDNEWGIDPFKVSPHNSKGEIVEDACVVAIYLPENAIAVSGPEGYPVVFNSTGKTAIGLYFKDSINGARGNDLWFGNYSAGGGFYLKKFDPEKEIVKVYYITPAEPLIKSAPVEIPENPELREVVKGPERVRILVASEDYIEFAKIVVLIAILLLTATVIASMYSMLRRK